MATARKLLVDADSPLYYHITSRCVQESWLMGTDKATAKKFDHRRDWLVKRLEQITPAFAVNIQTYAIMSNHFHLVVYYDPQLCGRWSDEEVARRWSIAHPSQLADPDSETCREEAIELLCEDQERLDHCRASLGSLSEFMKCIKQPIAARANRESDKGGHFWSARFYSGAILSEQALLTTMAYVDLNPVRAKIAKHIEECEHTGITQRLRAVEIDRKDLDAFLKPCFKGAETKDNQISVTLDFYRRFLRELIVLDRRKQRWSRRLNDLEGSEVLTREERWHIAKRSLGKKPRAIGGKADVAAWLERRGFSSRCALLPEHLY